MFFRTRKKDFHQSLIRKLHAAQYRDVKTGVCYGVSCMGLQAILLRDTAAYDKRINLLYDIDPRDLANKIADALTKWRLIESDIRKQLKLSCNDNEFEFKYHEAINRALNKLDSNEKHLLTANAFFNGVALHQSPQIYGYLFERDKKPLNQMLQASALILTPEALLERGGVKEVANFCGAYTIDEIRNNLLALQKTIFASGVKFPIGMILSNHNHALTIAFDPKYKKWLLIEADSGPTECLTEPALAIKINQLFSHTSTTIFNTEVYVTGDNRCAADDIINQWKKTTPYTQSHTITKERASYQDSDRATLLYIAAQNDHLDVVKEVLSKGANMNNVTSSCPTALYTACYYGYADIVKELLRCGADVNADNQYGATSIMVAGMQRHIDIVKELLDHQAFLFDIIKDKELIKLLHDYKESLQSESARQVESL